MKFHFAGNTLPHADRKNVACHLEFICAAIKKGQNVRKGLTLHNSCKSQQRTFIKMNYEKKQGTEEERICFKTCYKKCYKCYVTCLWCEGFTCSASRSFQEELNRGISILNEQHNPQPQMNDNSGINRKTDLRAKISVNITGQLKQGPNL